MAAEAERQKEIGARIKELRGRIPQPVIADQVGVTLRAYQAWEAGGGIAWENIGKLADALHVTEEYLLYGEAGRDGPTTQLDRIEALLVENSAKLDLLYGVATGEMPSDVISEAWLALAGTPAGGEPVVPDTEAPSGARRAARQSRS